MVITPNELTKIFSRVLPSNLTAACYLVIQENVNDLQTEADRSVQRCIVSSLHQQFPKLTVIGEEVSVYHVICNILV